VTSIASLRHQVAKLARQTRPHPVRRKLTTSENRHELARILGPLGIMPPRNRQEADELIEAIEAELGRRDTKEIG
jgi:hypothetical protein